MSARKWVIGVTLGVVALGAAGPVAAASAATGPFGSPVVPGLPTIGFQPGNPAAAAGIAAQGAIQAGALGAAAGAQAGNTEATTGNPFLAGGQALVGGLQAGITAAQAGFAAGVTAVGYPVVTFGTQIPSGVAFGIPVASATPLGLNR
jgi:hypothetical protein